MKLGKFNNLHQDGDRGKSFRWESKTLWNFPPWLRQGWRLVGSWTCGSLPSPPQSRWSSCPWGRCWRRWASPARSSSPCPTYIFHFVVKNSESELTLKAGVIWRGLGEASLKARRHLGQGLTKVSTDCTWLLTRMISDKMMITINALLLKRI